ncbi:hypothetical protein ACS0TY_025761 [Phlomoides rotata]
MFSCLLREQTARYDDIDDLMSIASTGVALDSKDSEGRTALHMASANGHLGIVEYLICNGALKKYMHSSCAPPVAHSNLKAANILLDEDLVPHVCVCGLAVLRPISSNNVKLKGNL